MTNQEENIKRFMMAKDKAKKLIQMDVQGDLDKVKVKAMSEGKISYNNNNVEYTENVPQQAPVAQNHINNNHQFNTVKNSKLPAEILESMLNNKIDTNKLGNGISSSESILDQLNSFTNGNLLKEENNTKHVEQRINEAQKQTFQPIDYSMIKMIVEETMKKYASTIKKSLLSENKKINENNSLQAMKIGNKFSFITKNGDLYEANLKFIKNINKIYE